MSEIWEKQSWDTNTGYDRFFRYYLPQRPPRSLEQAYRDWYYDEYGKELEKGRRAPRYWRCWHSGLNNFRKPIKGAIPWPDRADAWDRSRNAQEIVQMEQERQEQIQRVRVISQIALTKIAKAWQNFDPSNPEIRLSEIAQATKTLSDLLVRFYDLGLPDRQNELIIKDWRYEILQLIKDGKYTIEQAQQDLGPELTRRLIEAGDVG